MVLAPRPHPPPVLRQNALRIEEERQGVLSARLSEVFEAITERLMKELLSGQVATFQIGNLAKSGKLTHN